MMMLANVPSILFFMIQNHRTERGRYPAETNYLHTPTARLYSEKHTIKTMSEVIFLAPFPFHEVTWENWLCIVTLHTNVCQHDINIYRLEAMSRGHMSGNRWAWFKGCFICVREHVNARDRAACTHRLVDSAATRHPHPCQSNPGKLCSSYITQNSKSLSEIPCEFHINGVCILNQHSYVLHSEHENTIIIM